MARREGFNPKTVVGRAKAPLRLVPAALMIRTAVVQELGAAKYSPMNWRGYKVSHVTYLEAALRHILLAMDGEDVDPESGELHEAHVAACMAITIDARLVGNLVDDRYKTGKLAGLMREAQDRCAAIKAKYQKKPTGRTRARR